MGAMLAAVVLAFTFAATAEARPLDRHGLQQTFADEFDSFAPANPLDRQTWAAPRAWKTWYDHSEDPFNLHTRTLPANGENQAYTDAFWPPRVGGFPPAQHQVVNGVLRLRADRAPPTYRAQMFGKPYTSGMIASWGMFAQRYGVFEARVKLPKGRGLWPAFWMLNAEGGSPPEIDIMEFLGHDTSNYWVVTHSRQDGRRVTKSRQYPIAGDITAEYHVFSVDWRPTTITYYIDDQPVQQIATPPDMHRPMYMIFNLAVGGRWGGMPDAQTVFPAFYDIDYVRVWRRPGDHDPAPRPRTRKTS